MTAGKHFRKRDAILEYLRQTKSHPSAEMVYTHLKPQIPDLSLGTVYRNLSLFRKEGLIQSVGFVNGTERFDGNATPHTHFVCTGCGCVMDLMGLVMPQEVQEEACRESGGRIDSYLLSFTGLCRDCTC